MTRSINKKLSFWLTGYYDDFVGSRAIMDDLNTVSNNSTYDHSKTHHGNPMNGEAMLNPRYRFAYVERKAGSSGQDGASAGVFSTRFLHNQGIGEFLTFDAKRLANSNWVCKAQPQFPSSLVANRQKYGASGSDGYLKFSSSSGTHNTYLSPTGDNDSTFNRGTYNANSGVPATATGNFINSLHLIGVWTMYSQSENANSLTMKSSSPKITDQNKIFTNTVYRDIHSPSKQPFLHIKSFMVHGTSAQNIIHYDGDLGLTGTTTEYFHMRLTAFHHSDGSQNTTGALEDGSSNSHWQNGGDGVGSSGKSPIYTLKIGFPDTVTPTQTGYSGSAAIEWIWSPHMRYHPTSGANAAHHKSYGVTTDGGTAWNIDPVDFDLANGGNCEQPTANQVLTPNDSFWHDFDFKFDWDNRQYRVYVDGTEITSNSLMTGNTTAPYDMVHGSVTAVTAKGWELELALATETSSQTAAGTYNEPSYFHTLIDRAATYIDLSNPIHVSDETDVQVEKWGMTSVINGVSSADLELGDDEDRLGLESFFLNDRAWDWKLLCFRDNIDRPVWRGTIRDAEINQFNTKKNTKTIKIKATDAIYELDSTLPIWDLGQQGITVGDNDDYRREEQQDLIDRLYLGASKLRITQPEVFGSSTQNFKVLTNQRMKLHSAHPIQMYVGEDSFGPNEVWRDWENYPVAGFTYVSASQCKVWFPYDGSTNHPIYAASASSTFTLENSDDVNFATTTFTTTSTKGTYAHPNGQEKYQWVLCNISKAPSNNLNDLTITKLSSAKSNAYTYPNGRNAIVVLRVSNLVNATLGLNIRRGTYLSLSDDGSTSKDWNHDNDASTARQAYDYNGVWKVAAIHERHFSGDTVIYLDAPYFGPPGSSSTDVSHLKLTHVQGNAVYGTADTVNNSRMHTKWMKDIVANPWFKKRFGVIKKMPLFGYGAQGEGLDNTLDQALYLTSMGGYMANQLTVTTPASSTYNFTLNDNSAALVDLFAEHGNKLICEFYNPTNSALLGSAIITNIATTGTYTTTTNGWMGGAGNDADREYSSGVYYGDCDLIKAAFGYPLGDSQKFYQHDGSITNLWDKRVIFRMNSDTIGNKRSGFTVRLTGFDTELGVSGVDGGWILERVSDTMSSGVNKRGENYSLNAFQPFGNSRWYGYSSFNGTNWLGSSDNQAGWMGQGLTSSITNTGDFMSCYFLRKPGSREHLTWSSLGLDSESSSVPPAPSTTTDLTSGSPSRANTDVSHGHVIVTIDGEFAPRQNIPAGSVMKIRDVEDDFKHCWILWADMRNDGNADADGSQRKSDFGLLLPTPENYEVDLMFTDQYVEGAKNTWLNFKPGIDFDMWNMDSTTQPVIANQWSDNVSNDEWENKGGSFVVLDFSKFFNLNTEATGGQIGFTSGGKKDLGDYITDSSGFAALVDNYWAQAPTNNASPGSLSNYTLNENYHFWNVYVTQVVTNIMFGDDSIYVADASSFPFSGFGRLKAYNGEELVEDHYYSWHGKGTGTGPDGSDELKNVRTVSKASLISTYQQQVTTNNNYRGMSWKEFRDLVLGFYAFDYASPGQVGDVGASTSLRLKGDEETADATYDTIQVTSSLSDSYPLRLLMTLSGFIENKNSNTFHLHDQIRLLNSMSLTDNWMQTYSLPTMIKSPVTSDMFIDSSTSDSFGGILDVRNKSILNIVKSASENARVGSGGNIMNYNFLAGRDGFIEVRPTFNSGIVLNRTNSKSSVHKYNSRNKHTNVRVLYNQGQSFVDHPDPSTTSAPISFKVLDMANVISGAEARAIAKAEYQKLKNNAHSVVVKPIRDGYTTDLMLTAGRFGYIVDSSQNTYGGGNNWAAHARNATPLASNPFPGMVNAFDGNLEGGGTRGRGVSDLPNFTDSTHNNFDGNGWDSHSDGTPTGDSGRSITKTAVTYDEWFYWHGARSVSHAVEVVNIPHHMPLVSDTGGWPLRVTIALKPGQGTGDIDAAVFNVILTNVGRDSNYGDFSPTSTTENTGWTRVDVNKNGFYEIAVPSAYYSSTPQFSSSSKITINVNYDYLRDLLTFRSYNTTSGLLLRNAHNMEWLNGLSDTNAYNPNSIFPLGCRIYTQFGEMGELYTMRGAPRLHVVKDLSFVPASTIQYQDAQAGYSSETALSLKKVVWNMDRQQHEDVALTLEEDESKQALSFLGFIRPSYPSSQQFDHNSRLGRFVGGNGETQQPDDGSADVSFDSHTEEPVPDEATNQITEGSESFTDENSSGNSAGLQLHTGSGFGEGGTIFGSAASRTEYEETTIDALAFGHRITGNATITPYGVAYPGQQTSGVAEHTMLIPLPAGMMHTGFTVDVVASVGRNDLLTSSTSKAIIYGEISLIGNDTHKESNSITVRRNNIDVANGEDSDTGYESSALFDNMRGPENEINRAKFRMFDNINLPGASESGSTAKLTLYRAAGASGDDLTGNTVTIHSVQVTTRKVLGRKFSDEQSFQI